MTTLNFDVNNITTEQKITMIFSKLFKDSAEIEEEFFWNCLSEKEISELKNIAKEPTKHLSELKV